jgi:hypothetical protein
MAIVQISRITQRKGLAENLPQLAGGELGWAIDDRKLYIGNGTLAEGAPTVGNTEVLTEFSDILDLASSYTYKGEAAGYTVQTGPTASDPVTRTLQAVFDDYASIKDFGATGDGVTDDTAAINRAFYQLYCRDINVQIRRSLFFPAGTYRITSELLIPPFARLIGEGANSSIIVLDADSDSDYVARTVDSQQQTGLNVGSNGAIVPQLVEISEMAFSTEKVSNIFLLEDVSQVNVSNCNFYGPYAISDLTTAADNVSCVRFASSLSLVTNHVTFDSCRFSNMIYAVNTNEQIQGVVFSNSKFDTLYQGILLGTDSPVQGGPTGVRITQNLFDNIAYEGIIIGNIQKNVSGYNIFLNVANNFQGNGFPVAAIIDIQANNNVSVGDMFERNDADNTEHPRINNNDNQVFALDNGVRYKFGSYNREAGVKVFLNFTAVEINVPGFEISVDDDADSFIMEYRYHSATNGTTRYGRMTIVGVATGGSGTFSYSDDYTENGSTGITLTPVQVNEGNGPVIKINYIAPVDEGYFSYSLSHF